MHLKALNSCHALSGSKCSCKVPSAQVHLSYGNAIGRCERICRQHFHNHMFLTGQIKSSKPAKAENQPENRCTLLPLHFAAGAQTYFSIFCPLIYEMMLDCQKSPRENLDINPDLM